MITVEDTSRGTRTAALRPTDAPRGCPAGEALEHDPDRHPGSSPVIARLWRAPLAAHAGLSLLLMGLFGALIGARRAFTDDEGNVMIQARAIEHGHWALPSTLPAVDPTGAAFPLANVTLTPHGVAPLGKHLLYTSVISGIDRIVGPAGVLGLSILATVVAALGAARLARHHGHGLERISFWATVLMTPLFFYSFVLTGQTVGAAAVALSAVGTIGYLSRGRIGSLALAGASMAIAVAAREEALIWCAAACAGLLSVGRWRRSWPGYPVLRVVSAAAVTGGAGLLARSADVVLSRHFLGQAAQFSQTASTLLGGNRLVDQFRGAYIAIAGAGQGMDPLSRHRPVVFALTVAGLAASGACVRMLVHRRRPVPTAVLGVVAAGCVLVRWALEPDAVVAGLLAASPLVWAGIWMAAASPARGLAARWTVVTTALFAGGVMASVYSDGGGLQWGGRYFATGLPVVVALLARSAQLVAGRCGPQALRRVLAGAACAVAFAGVAQPATALVDAHGKTSAALAGLASAARQAPPGDGGKPVVVATSPGVGVLWSGEDRYRMLLAPDRATLSRLGSRLASAHVEGLVLISPSPLTDLRTLGAGYRLTTLVPSGPGWFSAVLAVDPARPGS